MKRVALVAVGMAVIGLVAWWILRDERTSTNATIADAGLSSTAKQEVNDDDAPDQALARSVFVEVLAKDRPVAGASIELTFGLGQRREVRSDISGLGVVEVGGAVTRARVRATGYEPVDVRPELPAEGDVSWTVQLTPAVVVDGGSALDVFRGIVLCDGAPHAGAVVTLLSDFERGVVVALAESDGEGRFRLETSVPAGELERIAVSSATCGTGDAPPAVDRELMIELLGEGALTVRVVDESGVAIDGANVRVARRVIPTWMYKRKSRKLNPALEATRKPLSQDAVGGVARFPALPRGEWSVVASAGGYSPSSERVLVEEAPATLTLTLGGVLTVSGRVTDSLTGNPLPGVRVVARLPHAGRGGFARGTTDTDGRYEMQTRPAQRQTLAFKKRGYVTTEISGVIGEAGERVERDAELTIVDARKGKFRSYVGIGAVLRKLDEGGVRIEKTIAGGPAASSLLEGDIVQSVDGEDVGDMALKDVVERVLGEEGEPVELEVLRDGEVQTVELERARMRVKR